VTNWENGYANRREEVYFFTRVKITIDVSERRGRRRGDRSGELSTADWWNDGELVAGFDDGRSLGVDGDVGLVQGEDCGGEHRGERWDVEDEFGANIGDGGAVGEGEGGCGRPGELAGAGEEENFDARHCERLEV